jgi:uncharacterized protein (TIGR02466 family)
MFNVTRDVFFYNFLYSAEPSVSVQDVLSVCYKAQNEIVGAEKSNRNGWQSAALVHPTNAVKALDDIGAEITNFANAICQEERLNISVKVQNFWININPANSHNVVHSHSSTDLIGLYYAQVPENSGTLCLVRNDSSLLSSLYTHKQDEVKLKIRPLPNRMYVFPSWMLHYVETNESEADRVSIAFNLVVEK